MATDNGHTHRRGAWRDAHSVKFGALVLALGAVLATPIAAQAALDLSDPTLTDPTDLHINAGGGTGTDPVLLNSRQSFTVSDTNASASIAQLTLIIATPIFGGVVSTPSIGTLTDSDTTETVTAGPELNFTTSPTGANGQTLFGTSAAKDLYTYIGCTTACDGSLNADNFDLGTQGTAFRNLFSSAMLATFQGFEVYEIPLNLLPNINMAPQTTITVGSTAVGNIADILPLGSYVAAIGLSPDGKKVFDTSFTNTGLVNTTSIDAPEPMSLSLLGLGLVGLGLARLRRR